jgi:hypothetical protein
MDLRVLAPVCAAVSSTSAGLCGFGDALLYHVCILFSHAVQGIDIPDSTFRFSVLCTSIMSSVALPLTLYLARAELRQCAPYGLSQASTGLLMVPVGTSLLFLGDLTAVKLAAGIFFTAFSSLLLYKSIGDELRERREAAAAAAAAVADEAAGVAASKEPPAAHLAAAAAAAAAALPYSTGSAYMPWPEPETSEEAPASTRARLTCSTLQAELDRRCHPPLGPLTGYTPSQTMGILACSGIGAGFLNGLLG